MPQTNKQRMNECVIWSNNRLPSTGNFAMGGRPFQMSASRENAATDRSAHTNPAREGRTLQSGTHLARITTLAQDDGTFEAQVYVRLTREPEIAETYLPAGIFATEAEAWAAAEIRARRALDEDEF